MSGIIEGLKVSDGSTFHDKRAIHASKSDGIAEPADGGGETSMVKFNACEHKKAASVLLWWVDCFLAMVVGIDAWGPTLLGPISF